MKWKSETNSTSNHKKELSPTSNNIPGSSNGIRTRAENFITFLAIVLGSIICLNKRSM